MTRCYTTSWDLTAPRRGTFHEAGWLTALARWKSHVEDKSVSV